MSDKTQILFACSEEFKDAISKYAQQNNQSLSKMIRDVLAAHVGYDLKNEQTKDGRRKYSSKEERQKQVTIRQKQERMNVKNMLEIYAREQRRIDAAILEASLNKKGINTDDIHQE